MFHRYFRFVLLFLWLGCCVYAHALYFSCLYNASIQNNTHRTILPLKQAKRNNNKNHIHTTWKHIEKCFTISKAVEHTTTCGSRIFVLISFQNTLSYGYLKYIKIYPARSTNPNIQSFSMCMFCLCFEEADIFSMHTRENRHQQWNDERERVPHTVK